MQNAECSGHFSLSKPVMESPSKENSPTKKEKSVGELSDNAECRMQNCGQELSARGSGQIAFIPVIARSAERDAAISTKHETCLS
ncbi:MAG: hypothetical protein LBL66_02540 [Clostridiales bacterium]|nr:hypothetical protein [Clostridiales bacterium]